MVSGLTPHSMYANSDKKKLKWLTTWKKKKCNINHKKSGRFSLSPIFLNSIAKNSQITAKDDIYCIKKMLSVLIVPSRYHSMTNCGHFKQHHLTHVYQRTAIFAPKIRDAHFDAIPQSTALWFPPRVWQNKSARLYYYKTTYFYRLK